MESLTQRYYEKISGVLCCYDRIVITGTLPVLSNAHHLTSYMYLFYHTMPKRVETREKTFC